MQFTWQKIGQLDCIVKPAKEEGPCVILFHGYGADANDLYPLNSYLKLQDNVTWIFPQGPLQILVAPGFSGRAWFEINVQELERAMASGEYRDMSRIRPPGFDEALKMAKDTFEVCLDNYSKVALGGFSQGAMLATEVALANEMKPDCLLILSGTLLDKDTWAKLAESCKGLPFFQSHGSNDALLSPKIAGQLEQLLKSGGLEGHLIQFKGGHEIPLPVLDQLKSFLEKRGY